MRTMCFCVSNAGGVTCRKKIRWKLGSFEERRSDALNSIHGADGVLGVQPLNVLPIVTAHLVTGGHILQNIADLRAARIGIGKRWFIWVEFQFTFVRLKTSFAICSIVLSLCGCGQSNRGLGT